MELSETCCRRTASWTQEDKKTSLDFNRENEQRDERSENNLVDIEELRMTGKPLQSGGWLVD